MIRDKKINIHTASGAVFLRFRYVFSRCVLFFLLLSFSHLADAQGIGWNQRYQNYINTYRDVAIYEMLKYGIPASITMAQGILESGAGQSELAQKGNNHFGIKCHDWRGPSMKRDDDEAGECFRVYASPFESYEDHSKFLLRPRYQRLFSLRKTDYNLDALDNERHYDEAALRRIASGVSINAVISGNDIASSSGAHIVRMNNRNYYVIARDGDTFRSIAKEFGVSYRKLAKYNERGKKDILRNGEIVYLEKKRTKADKSFKRRPHIVRAGESMYSIAQAYGVRLKSLYKKNNMSPDHSIHVGDKIRVY